MENIKPDNLPFPISEKLYKFILRCKAKITYEDTFIVGILWGGVGGGKSVRAQQFAYITNGEGKTTLDMISFDKDEFVKSILKNRLKCLIPDEGIAIIFSRSAMSKHGRLMIELLAQSRQKNLILIFCIPDVLSVDSYVLNMANFIGYVWESRKEINGRMVTIKGNMSLFPMFRQNNYKARMLQYLKIRKSNPLIKAKPPQPYLIESGSPYGEGFKPAFYVVPEIEYKAKKESILDKYRHQLERKPKNPNVDYPTMDKLLKLKTPKVRIAKILNCSISTVNNRTKDLQLKAKILRAKKMS